MLKVNDRFPNSIGALYADIRFFPQRKGTFADLPIDGRRAISWSKRARRRGGIRSCVSGTALRYAGR